MPMAPVIMFLIVVIQNCFIVVLIAKAYSDLAVEAPSGSLQAKVVVKFGIRYIAALE